MVILSSCPLLTLDQSEVFRVYTQIDAFHGSLYQFEVRTLIHSFLVDSVLEFRHHVVLVLVSLAHEWNVS